MWGAIGLDTIGLYIPIVRQLTGIIYLTFIPGILIIRVLKLHNLDSIETLLYSVGLSITTLMFVGLLMNTFYPRVGISKPISAIPLIITISIIVLLLCVLCYIMDKDVFNPSSCFINVKYILSYQALFLYQIPFLAIFGTYLVNFYGNNIILLLLLFIIAIVIFGGFDNIIEEKYYPLAIFVIALSLLYHISLISMYLVEWADISFEYWVAKLVLLNSIWDPTIYSNVNAMLSISMLAPIISIISGLELIWVFKIIYPLLFSLVPLGLYKVFQKQTDAKIAFLSVCFFMSMFMFYTIMLGLARQQIAELYFIIIILLLMDKQMVKMKRSFLLILSLFSLAVSHYALSYMYLLTIISAWFILILASNHDIQNFAKKYVDKYCFGNTIVSHIPKTKTISTTFVLLSIVVILTWYIHVTGSSAFNSIVQIGNIIANTIFTDFLNPAETQGLEIIFSKSKSGFIGRIYKMIHLIAQLFIVIGLIHSVLKWKSNRFHSEYLAISIPFIGMLIAGVVIPHVASTVNTSRLYGISLLVLSPYSVVGAIFVLEVLNNIVNKPFTSKRLSVVLYLFFMIFFLFNSGFIHEFAGHPTSFALNQTNINTTVFELQDVNAVTWLSRSIDSNDIVYADAKYAYLTKMELGYFYPLKKTKDGTNTIPDDTYLVLGVKNIKDEVIWLDDPLKSRMNTTMMNYKNSTLSNTIYSMNEIFNNGDAKVYFH